MCEYTYLMCYIRVYNELYMSTPASFNVFDGFGEYQVKILFQGWYTATVWQFVLSCLGLFVFTVVYHLIRWARASIEQSIRLATNKLSDKYIAEETVRLVHTNNTPPTANSRREQELFGLYVGLFFLSVFLNAIWLFVNMANMTFNPWVFISVVLGHAVGEVSVHAKIVKLSSSSSI